MKVQFSYRINDDLLKEVKKRAIDWDSNVSETITLFLLMGMSLYDMSLEKEKTVDDVFKLYNKKYGIYFED